MHILLWFYLNLPMLPNCYFQPPPWSHFSKRLLLRQGQVSQISSRQDLRWGPESIAISCLKKAKRWLNSDWFKVHRTIWLVVSTYPSEKWWSEFVSWDDEIPNWMESHEIHVPNHQADRYLEDHPTDRLTWLTMVIVSSRFLGFSHV